MTIFPNSVLKISSSKKMWPYSTALNRKLINHSMSMRARDSDCPWWDVAFSLCC